MKNGLQGIEDIDPRVTVIKETASVIPFLIKTAVVCGIGYYVYYSFTNRFIKLKENSKFAPANISDAQAKTRADAIISAKSLFDQFDFGSQFQATATALKGLNYNAFIKVYNAFGHQSGHFLSGDKNLIEFLQDQFSAYEILNLSSLQNGVFFKNSEYNSDESQALQLLFIN